MLVNFTLWLQILGIFFFLQVVPVYPLELDSAMRYGFAIRTQAQDPALASDALYVNYTGPIAFPLAENLEEIWRAAKDTIHDVTFEIDSMGGDVEVARQVSDLFKEISKIAKLTTRVGPGKTCASACLPIYMQGSVRQASGASAFTFHGSCTPYTNIPQREATDRFVEMLRSEGISRIFLDDLSSRGYFSMSGEYWLSGYELYHIAQANVITELLPSWTPAMPILPPFDPLLRPR